MTVEELEYFVRDKIGLSEQNRQHAEDDGRKMTVYWQDGYRTAMMDVLECIKSMQPR